MSSVHGTQTIASTSHGAARPRNMSRMWHFISEYLLLLPVGAAIAMLWANLAPESYFPAARGAEVFVNDIALALFIGLIMKEVTEATLTGGVLHSWRRAALPLVGALGLTVFPLVVFIGLAPQFGEPRVAEGWPVVFAVDLAFGYFVARLIFGRHPVIPFFLLTAICANALGIVALGFAVNPTSWRPGVAAVLMAAAMASAYLLRRLRTRTFWSYIFGAGALSWYALYFGGFEPALALVPVVPFLPHAARDPGFFVDAPADARDTLNRFEQWVRHPAQIALLLFGLVNAGVPLRALDYGTWALPMAMLLMRPLGFLIAVDAGVALGLHLPAHISWRELVVTAFVLTIGFTMALFFATSAMGAGPALSAIKIGALLSAGGAVLSFAAAKILRIAPAGR